MSMGSTVVLGVGVNSNPLFDKIALMDEVSLYNIVDINCSLNLDDNMKKDFVDNARNIMLTKGVVIVGVSARDQAYHDIAVMLCRTAKENRSLVIVAVTDIAEASIDVSFNQLKEVGDTIIYLSNEDCQKYYEVNKEFYRDVNETKNAAYFTCVYSVLGMMFRKGMFDIDDYELVTFLKDNGRVKFGFGRSHVIKKDSGKRAFESVNTDINGKENVDAIFIAFDLNNLPEFSTYQEAVNGYYNDDMFLFFTSVLPEPDIKRAIVDSADHNYNVSNECISTVLIGVA